ncbi:hypothetical protein PanWU01x14_142330 [Parasponia andersonii]|uniref:Uncharacterized protein n=1 Tax=Parasponia andersonii TaxID=3476 RepID=A0A2P5CLF8_PARAD|nr:hypothetical protein PanWU01x14_142330 [Parasponia andersonii]
MALSNSISVSVSISTTTPKPNYTCSLSFRHERPFLALPISLSTNTHRFPLLRVAAAAKSQTGPVEKKRSSSSTNKKRKKKGKRGGAVDDGDGNNAQSDGLSFSEVEIVEDESGLGAVESSISGSDSRSLGYYGTPLPKPPAGFVVGDHGKVLMASTKRIATIVSSFSMLKSLLLLFLFRF